MKIRIALFALYLIATEALASGYWTPSWLGRILSMLGYPGFEQ